MCRLTETYRAYRVLHLLRRFVAQYVANIYLTVSHYISVMYLSNLSNLSDYSSNLSNLSNYPRDLSNYPSNLSNKPNQ